MLRTLIWSLNLQKRSGRLRSEWSKTLETSLSLSKNEFGSVRKRRSNFLKKVNRDNGIFFYLTEYSSRYNGVSDVRLTDQVGGSTGWIWSRVDLRVGPGRTSGRTRGITGSDFRVGSCNSGEEDDWRVVVTRRRERLRVGGA